MEAMREAWTDDRLDDLNHKVDEGFRKVDQRFNRLEAEIDRRFERLEERLERRFDSLNRNLLLFSGSTIVALFGVIAAVA
jgi:hypothetical protein